MKKIWINLELYFESYKFSNFEGFFWIFWNLFLNLNRLKQLKKNKKAVYFCAGPTWMRRGTLGHVGEPRGPTRALTWCGSDTCVYIYIYS